MQLLYGTTNPAKLAMMRKRLSSLPIELIGISDLDTIPPDPVEDGDTPLENARIKATQYRAHTGLTTLAADSGLYIDGLPVDLQPGVHVRRPGAERLDDDGMIAYYGALAVSLGGKMTARYRNAVCIAVADGPVAERCDDSVASQPFIITEKPHARRRQGFPLDSLSIHIETGEYYYDMQDYRADSELAQDDGFYRFVKEALSL